MTNQGKWIIGLALVVPITCCGTFFGFGEIIRYSLGTIEYHVMPGLTEDIFVLSPLGKPEPVPGHFNYNFNTKIVILKDPLRRSAGRITGFIGKKRYPNVCYPKFAKADEFGLWQGNLLLMKTIPGYEIWMFHVGKASDALKYPTKQDISTMQAKLRVDAESTMGK